DATERHTDLNSVRVIDSRKTPMPIHPEPANLPEPSALRQPDSAEPLLTLRTITLLSTGSSIGLRPSEVLDSNCTLRSDDTDARKYAGHAHAVGGTEPGGTSGSRRQSAAANPPSRWLPLAGSGRLQASGRRALTRVGLVPCTRRSRPTT